MALLPVAEALARLLAAAEPIRGRPQSTEHLQLAEALGRVLAEDLVAGRDQPPFDASAMDGYAVRADDAVAGAVLSVIGQSAAGHAFKGQIGAGETVRIFTGAPVPSGADTILIQENAESIAADRIKVVEAAMPSRHIRRRGLDFATGDRLLEAGFILDAGRLTLAAAMNRPSVPVLRKPRVAVLATGDELVAAGDTPGEDQIIASNTVGIAAILSSVGAETVDLGIVADRQPAIEAAIGRAEDDNCDVLVTVGGASVGDHDLVQAALTARGMTLDFWKIAMRPGKPLMSGKLAGMQVIGLPGNPVSSLVCTHLFVVPHVKALLGLPSGPHLQRATLGADLPANDLRQDYLRASLSKDKAGSLVAHPFAPQDSSMMRLFSLADCLIVRPPHAAKAAMGEECDVLVLRNSSNGSLPA